MRPWRTTISTARAHGTMSRPTRPVRTNVRAPLGLVEAEAAVGPPAGRAPRPARAPRRTRPGRARAARDVGPRRRRGTATRRRGCRSRRRRARGAGACRSAGRAARAAPARWPRAPTITAASSTRRTGQAVEQPGLAERAARPAGAAPRPRPAGSRRPGCGTPPRRCRIDGPTNQRSTAALSGRGGGRTPRSAPAPRAGAS